MVLGWWAFFYERCASVWRPWLPRVCPPFGLICARGQIFPVFGKHSIAQIVRAGSLRQAKEDATREAVVLMDGLSSAVLLDGRSDVSNSF